MSITPCGSMTPRRALSLGLALVFLLALVPAAPGQALAAQDDTVPGVPVSGRLEDSLTTGTDLRDVFRVYLLVGERVDVSMTEGNPPATDFDIYLYPPTATDLAGPPVAVSAGGANPETFTYIAGANGWHYIEVRRWGGTGAYLLETYRDWPGPQPPASPERVWGSDRYTTAVAIAQKNFPGWVNCDHVIIASGEDRAAADPLAAAGLSWTYGAPILLVQSDAVPSAVMSALAGISAANGGVTVHVVGGPASVPEARLAQITSQVPGVTFDRLLPAGNRFELAATIAHRMNAERPTGHFLWPVGKIALIANGADPDKFFDALALSAVSASTGYPILLVNQDSIPSQTTHALSSLGIQGRIVGGGPATVSNDVLATLDAGPPQAERVAGNDRYDTAAAIASGFTGLFLSSANTGVAAKLPDALTGGAFMGLRGGPIMVTPTDQLGPAPRQYLHTRTTAIGDCYVLGGPASMTNTTKTQIGQALQP